MTTPGRWGGETGSGNGNSRPRVYMGTVCLERNRWGTRQPSFRVSDWLARFAADGFDGIELWENHFLAADETERDRLVAGAAPVAVYNSYVSFEDGAGEWRGRAAEAVRRLSAQAVKFNLGADAARVGEYRSNLLAWAGSLPASCRLLCECHPGTVLEQAEAAAAFVAELDPARFGIIAHIAGNADAVGPWFAALGPRIAHLHVQLRAAESSPTVPAGRAALAACFAVARAHAFGGSATIEFTRGIGRDERIDAVYANACVDLGYCREALAGGAA